MSAIPICNHNHEAFLVYDRSLGSNDAPFYFWLSDKGFKFAGHHGNFGCTWVYVDITHKEFAYGMPGIPVMAIVGHHAITLDEFLTIYYIYKKYEGKNPLSFNSIDRD